MKSVYISLFSLLLSLSITSCQTKTDYFYFSAIEDNKEALFMKVYIEEVKNKEDEKLRRQKVEEIKKLYIANLIKYFQKHPEYPRTVQRFLESYHKLSDAEENRRETGVKPDPQKFLKWMAAPLKSKKQKTGQKSYPKEKLEKDNNLLIDDELQLRD